MIVATRHFKATAAASISPTPMIRFFCLALLFLSFVATAPAADPLRIFIRGGTKDHGPGQHDHPRFLEEWTKLLTERGAKVDGAQAGPTPEQFAATDVIIVFAANPWDVTPEQEAELKKFAARGGGFIALHDG